VAIIISFALDENLLITKGDVPLISREITRMSGLVITTGAEIEAVAMG
jgi:hypothetical protein